MLRSVARNLYYLIINIKYNLSSKNIHLCISAKIKKGTTIEGPNKVGAKTYVSGEIGSYTYIGANCRLGNVKIGRYCSISPNVKVVTGKHPLNYISTSPVFFSTAGQCGASFVSSDMYNDVITTDDGYDCEIGNDVWIGENVLIKGGVRIGDGAVIAMGAVVTRNVEPYAIYGGVPARCIKKRFENDDIRRALQESKWWVLPESSLRNLLPYISDPCEFVKKIRDEVR